MYEPPIGSILSGIEFNKMYNGKRFYKFIDKNLNYGLKYKEGLNIESGMINPSDSCVPDSLYFCAENDCHKFWKDYDEAYISEITISDDTKVYVECEKFKADKLILNKIMEFCDMPDDFWMEILCYDCAALKYIKLDNVCYEEICEQVVRHDGYALEHVKKQTEKICTFAVKTNGMALEFVMPEYQTEEIYKLAVQENAYAL